MNNEEDARKIARLSGKLAHHLKGKGPQVQGGVLADLTAMWLAGFVAPGDPAGTERLRADILAHQIKTIAELTEVNAKMIGAELLASEPAGRG